MVLAKKGSTGEIVRQLQRQLTAHGYNPGTIDGIFGTKTETALMSYQEFLGVEADGVLGSWVANKLGITVDSARSIVLTAGHSNTDPGACSNDEQEAKVVLGIRNAVAELLRARGISVITDGEGDENQPLSKAKKLVGQAPLAVELHLNSGAATSNGVECLAHADKTVQSQTIAQAVADAYGWRLRGNLGYKTADSGQHSRLAYCDAGGIVAELFFISNASELAAYKAQPAILHDALANCLASLV